SGNRTSRGGTRPAARAARRTRPRARNARRRQRTLSGAYARTRPIARSTPPGRVAPINARCLCAHPAWTAAPSRPPCLPPRPDTRGRSPRMTEETEVATPKERVIVDDRPIVGPTVDGSGQHEGMAGDGDTPESGIGANGARRRRRRGGRGRGRGGASRPTGAGADSPETTSGATDTTDVGGSDEVTETTPE